MWKEDKNKAFENLKIVILDENIITKDGLSWERLKEFGELTVYHNTPQGEIIKRCKDADVILTSKCRITKAVIDACEKLKYIGVLATGYNMVDLEYAKEKSITVTNVPAYSTASVAQFTISMILMLATHAEQHAQAVKKGMWVTSKEFCFTMTPQIELEKKVLGIIGFGRIGRSVARIASAMGMKVVIATNHPDEIFRRENKNVQFASQDYTMRTADILSLHCPLTDENEGFIDKTNISKMKNGVMLVNVARGKLINEKDLAENLRSGKIKAAALDVLSVEPAQKDNVLLTEPNCFITPHMAWATREARERLINWTYDNLAAFLQGEVLNRLA
ncbi:D-2-hydroxyacid dehydrogenase [Anaerovorax odorimutans]|uniref:D-2-hydroxyacid dehydrogenase n=1 Tax=Anaerovorax odorimutans TaxID=109327 RepID=A0ABT1RP84_9FIRM|nr:D-2-hydroxyacid dehydrogenase [Anaerovorax odorimutans]MCQ4637003.1 D-2-hydroxyacid dehydrogenase [Anaerovorax odorimutans]